MYAYTILDISHSFQAWATVVAVSELSPNNRDDHRHLQRRSIPNRRYAGQVVLVAGQLTRDQIGKWRNASYRASSSVKIWLSCETASVSWNLPSTSARQCWAAISRNRLFSAVSAYDYARYPVPSEGMIGSVGQGFIDRPGEVISGVLVEETVDPTPESPLAKRWHCARERQRSRPAAGQSAAAP